MINYPRHLSREERIETITELCNHEECSHKIRKIHFDQFVERDWHPHPPADFVEWWETKLLQTSVATAWNVQAYRDEFSELQRIGAISPS
jgi:hypothetical protein